MQLLHSKILGKGDPLIILHGLFGLGDNWITLAKRFAADFEVHLIDQRNHGRSFHSDDFSYELMVEDLLYYLSHYKLEKVNLLGHSMGGKTAMLFAVEFPEKVNKLIVADIAPKSYPLHHQFILRSLQDIDFKKVGSRNEIEAILSKDIDDPGIRQFLMKNIYRLKDGGFALRFNLESILENIKEVGEALPAYSVYEGETLFLKGERSGYITDKDKDLIDAHFPDNRIAGIKNAGHWLHAENPDDFYKTVIRFIKK